MSTNVFELPAHDGEAARELTPRGLGAPRAQRRRDLRGARPRPRHAGHARHAAAVRAGAVRRDGRLRRRPEAAHALPDRAARGRRGPPRADRRGPRRLLRALRAPRAAVPRPRPRRLRRRRRDPRHLEAHAARAALRAALHRAGAARGGDRGRAAASSPARAASRSGSRRRTCAPRCAASRRTAPLTVTTVWRGLYDEDESLRSRVPYADAVIEPFSVLAEDDDLPRWDVPDAARASSTAARSASTSRASSRTSSSRSTASWPCRGCRARTP